MKKVLHITESMGVGGTEKLLIATFPELTMYENHLIVLRPPDTLLHKVPSSVKTTLLDFRSIRDLWRIRRIVKKYIREHQIDIVHAHLYWPHVVSRMLRKMPVKIFNTIHALSSKAIYNSWKLLLIERLTYHKKIHMVGVSHEVLNDFDKWVGIKGKSSVIYNIIDDRFFVKQTRTDFPGNQLRLVATGNLKEVKNYPYMLEAFKTMPPEISLDIYGVGEMQEELQATIDRYKLNVKLRGHSDNLYEQLPSYDAFLMCSFYEGFSLSLMEGMAAGLPGILSDVPVLKEAGGDTALYVNLSDPADLVRVATHLLHNKSQLPDLSHRAWKRAAELTSKEQYIRKLVALYEG